jgi:hypothetical protein
VGIDQNNDAASYALDATGPVSVPVVNAGGNQTVQGGSFTLSGSATSPSGAPLTYLWTQLSGPPAVIQNPDELSTTVNGVTPPATLKFRLTATDTNDHTSSSSDVTITVHSTSPK